MKPLAAALALMVSLIFGCNNASSVTPPPASSKKVDIHVDAPGVKVDVNGKKQEP